MAPATTAQSIQAEAERLARQIVLRLEAAEDALRGAWDGSGPVQHIVVDDLLAPADAAAIAANMPRPEALHLKSSLRERKRVGVDIDRYDPIVGGILLAFQRPSVIEVVARITKLAEMCADPSLYASGISVMGRGDFLNPHLDNSHDGDQVLYRTVNLLYYVSPDWDPASGGNLELWDPALRSREVVACRFNRLAVMATNQTSWHSVQRVVADAPRMCISNYYFSPSPPGGVAYRNVTSFRGRPEEPMKRVLLWLDSHALNALGRVAPGLLKRNRHRRRTN